MGQIFVYITKFRVADYKQPHGICGWMEKRQERSQIKVWVCVCNMTDQNIEAAALCTEFPKAARGDEGSNGVSKTRPVASGIWISCKAKAKVFLISWLMTNTYTAGCRDSPGWGCSSFSTHLITVEKQKEAQDEIFRLDFLPFSQLGN